MSVQARTAQPGGAWAARKVLGDQLYVSAKLADQILAVTGLRVTPAQDGQIHRHDHPDGKRGNKRVWLVCRHNVAVWGDWATGEQHAVFPDGQQDPEAARQARQEAEHAKRERQAEVERERAHVARQCRHEWPGLPAADPHHPYLVHKAIQPLALRQDGDKLMVPMYYELILTNIQAITPDGSKRFRTGGRKKGAYYPVGGLRPGVPLLICEGVATGHTLHQATGYPVACAMDAGNLLPVTLSLRARHPNLAIIVAADNDHRTDGNPGVTAGKAAASAAGGRCVWPTFLEGSDGSDWNDLAAIGGEVSL